MKQSSILGEVKSLLLLRYFFPLVSLILSVGYTTLAWAMFPIANKPVTIVVPTPAKGGNDVMARILSQRLAEGLKVNVNVENKVGDQGTTASLYVANAPKDGHTLLFGNTATHSINPALGQAGYDPINDFTPISLLAESPVILVVTPDLPIYSVKELIAYAKSSKTPLKYASTGPSTIPHIAAELLKTHGKIDAEPSAYKGSGPAVEDVSGGKVQFMFPSLIASYRRIQSGDLRPLAIAGRKRSALLPDVPTMTEVGLKGFELTQWYGLFGPAKLPKDIVNRISQEIAVAMREPELIKLFVENGVDPEVRGPAAFATYIQADMNVWKARLSSSSKK